MSSIPWIERFRIYLDFYFKAETRYNIHSPFLFDLIEFAFDTDRIYYDFNILQEATNCILRNQTSIPADDFSVKHRQNNLNISQLFLKSGHSSDAYECLYRLACFLKPNKILELGSCAGMSAMSLALGYKPAKVISLEGNEYLSSFANSLFHQFKLNTIQCLHIDFNTFFETQTENDFDLVFVDGDHNYESTLANFSKINPCTSDKAVIVLDDVHWSSGMYAAWNKIKQDPSIRCSLETIRWGFLFKNKSLAKGDYTFLHEKFKPWKLGLF
jgi:predicted O-methyltransferase YrrM